MPKKLAIVISGVVSLGSYEAGVMDEIIEAIARIYIGKPLMKLVLTSTLRFWL
ncbi:hypothetical protein [Nostoc sp.]|uniref:hypothetical protein n=1 Tax=Nostoc sp. TaxID=1180 RepID=UPI002FF88ACD